MTDTLLAPNEQDEIAYTMTEHPEIDPMNEEARGEIIQITAARLNARRDRPWGRKARNADPNNPNCNTDAMTYLRPDGLFEIIDVISGIDGSAMWGECGAFAPGENGYWYAVPGDQMGEGGDTIDDVLGMLDEMGASIAQLQTELNALTDRVTTVETTVAQPQHCHGPINLPVVMDGFSLRTVGDIDVAVSPGEATPPPPPGEPPSLLDVAALKRLLDRLRPGASGETP
jgi:uncharacterized coiled-coil protein SlyX